MLILLLFLLRKIVIEDFNLGGLVRELAPDDQTAGAAGFDDAPLVADPNDTARQILLAQGLARDDFRSVVLGVELASGDVACQPEGRFRRCLGACL